MLTRRGFAAGLAVGGMLPVALRQRAEAETPVLYISSQKRSDGSHAAVAINADGNIHFEETLPDRGHDAAISPDQRTAVLFARRPGRFALVMDLRNRKPAFGFEAPADRHFYGHGFFSPDGHLLFASENDFDNENGVIGIYDVAVGYRRLGEFRSGGIGPHQILLKRDQHTIVVANGGLVTHPDFPRQKLNLAEMTPSLAYIDLASGDLVERAELPAFLHQLSIRHITEAADGSIWFGGQYEGYAADHVPLVGRHQQGREIELIEASEPAYKAMNHYVGSIAASRDGKRIATTGPRGGQVMIWDTIKRDLIETRKISDVCGVAPSHRGFIMTDGWGRVWRGDTRISQHTGAAWDNHLRRV